MIGRITGTLIEKLPPTVCVDVNGLGYDIDVPMSTLYALPENGARVTLYTHLTVREDATSCMASPRPANAAPSAS